jgi:purine-binding chemotaxis protein CheW
MLLVHAGDLIAALPLTNIVETMRPLRLETLSEMPVFVQGLSIIRGQSTPIVDLGLLLQGEVPGLGRRWVVLRVGERRVALAVEAVLGIQALEPAALRDRPPLLSRTHPDLIQGLGALDQGLLLVLEPAHILPRERWPALKATGEGHAL